jgi:putative endonuclease
MNRGVIMPLSRRERGALGEKIALDFLVKRNFTILERNFRCREGEIDIIARQGDCLVFVEVRTKTSTKLGTPEESITPAKTQRLVALAQTYLQSHENLPAQWRIDVIAIDMDRQG